MKMKEGSREREMYESMLDSEMAKSWAQSDGIGLANVLYQQLKHNKGKQA
jgi:Rod binding domain-containing protein